MEADGGIPKLPFLPESHTDFPFTVTVESGRVWMVVGLVLIAAVGGIWAMRRRRR